MAGSMPDIPSNWGKNVLLQDAKLCEPGTIAELQEIVKAAMRSVRVIGAGHSFAPVCASEVLITLRKLRSITLSEDRKSVTADGGATFTDLVEFLNPHGLATKNWASLPHVTIAGVLATATHGSGLKLGHEGCLTSLCSSIEFVTADGSLVKYSRDDSDPTAFRRAVVHLGLLGVVSRVTIDVVPAFQVTQHVYRGHAPLARLLEVYHQYANSCDSFTTGLNIGTGEITLWFRYYHTPQGTAPTEQPAAVILDGPGYEGLKMLQGAVPFYELGPGAEGVKTTRTGPWHDVPTFFMDDGKERDMPATALQSEFFVPLDKAVEALAATQACASQWPGWLHADNAKGTQYESIPLVFHCEVRVVPSDGLAGLSPFADRPALGIHFTWGPAEYVPHIMELVATLQDALRPFGVRPHWGKLNSMSSPELDGLYQAGELQAFRDLAAEHDPHGKFVNDYLKKQLFSGKSSA